MAKFKGPEGITSVSVGGEEFNVDKDGCISVPDSIEGAHVALASHGFVGVADPAAEKAAAKAAVQAAKAATDAAKGAAAPDAA